MIGNLRLGANRRKRETIRRISYQTDDGDDGFRIPNGVFNHDIISFRRLLGVEGT